jgi:hypothetical protein
MPQGLAWWLSLAARQRWIYWENECWEGEKEGAEREGWAVLQWYKGAKRMAGNCL